MSIINEEWRSISGFINYQVSNIGRVRNARNGKILKPTPHKTQGYLFVNVRCPEQVKFVKVHRLVAQEFIPNPEDKPFVDHIDRNVLNNCLSNLRWVTNQENSMNATKQRNTSSTYKGVSFRKDNLKWEAKIMKDRKTIHLGLHRLEKDAARAYNAKAVELFGEYACLNEFSDTED